MEKIVFIIPYFGQVHNYFALFLESCRRNDTIDFIFVSDLGFEELPPNCKVIPLSFEGFKEAVEQKLGFKANINQIYKIVDYKPMYGDLFESEIKEYDYWGYCDCDMILGNLRGYLNKIDMSQYEKIFCHGHMTILKNSEKMRKMYLRQGDFIDEGIFDYKEAFSTPCIVHFDEGGGFTKLCDYYDVISFEDVVYADISFSKKRFTLAQPVADAQKKCLFTYEDGCLYRATLDENGGGVLLQSYIYIHLQKRKMNVLLDSVTSKYNIYPNAFVPYEKISGDLILQNSEEAFYARELLRKIKMFFYRFTVERLKITYRNKKIKRRKAYAQINQKNGEEN